MNPIASPSAARRRPQQRGISLIVSLVLLVVVTLLALGSMRGVVLQSRMSGSMHDRGLAFQAAEVALREAEQRALAATAADIPASGAACSNGFCATPALNSTPRWLNSSFTGWRSATSDAPADAQAVVEDMGDSASAWDGCENRIPVPVNCVKHRYVVTARSAADGRATVLVQSQIAAP